MGSHGIEVPFNKAAPVHARKQPGCRYKLNLPVPVGTTGNKAPAVVGLAQELALTYE